MKPVRILYIEDEGFLGKIVKESLESRGFEIHMEEDGSKALDLYHRCEPDVCVLDIMVPGVDGFEIAKQIRAHNATIPVLFLTAKSQTEDVVKGFRMGGNDYIRKPFSMEELIVRLENLLRSKMTPTASHAHLLQIGQYIFDINRQLLTGKESADKLSHREAALLIALHQHKNRIINRVDILNLLWGNDNFFNSRNLDVYITKLRGYFKADPTVEILTIKGVGYRFVF